jgi:hypothetical protein
VKEFITMLDDYVEKRYAANVLEGASV